VIKDNIVYVIKTTIVLKFILMMEKFIRRIKDSTTMTSCSVAACCIDKNGNCVFTDYLHDRFLVSDRNGEIRYLHDGDLTVPYGVGIDF